jgi:hypothetical protein
MSDKVIFEFNKSKAEKIVVSCNEYEGKDYYHIRTYIHNSLHGKDEWLPTPKGISVSYGNLDNLFFGVEKLKKFIKNGEISNNANLVPAVVLSHDELVSSFDGGLPF